MAAPFEKWKLEVVAKHFKLDDEKASSVKLKKIVGEHFSDSIDFLSLEEESNVCENFKHDLNGNIKVLTCDVPHMESAIVNKVDKPKQMLANSMAIRLDDVECVGDFCRILSEDSIKHVFDETAKKVIGLEVTSLSVNKETDSNLAAVAGGDPQEVFIDQDVRFTKQNKEVEEWAGSSCVETGRNCASFILIWEKEEFYKKLGGRRNEGGIRMRNILGDISRCLDSLPLRGADLKFESQSLIGNQVRKDFVLSSWEQAKDFVNKVKESVSIPQNVTLKPVVLSEEYFGLNLEPELTEEDVLLLVKDDQNKNLFRHFLSCRILTEGDKITFRFKSLSDVNLFVFNKGLPSRRTLGQLRIDGQEQLLKLEPDKDGILTLHSNDLSMKTKDWMDLETRFMFSTRKKGGRNYLLFKNKKDLFYFLVSEESKVLSSLWLTKSQIVGKEPRHLELLLTDTDKKEKFLIETKKRELSLGNTKKELLLRSTKKRELRLRDAKKRGQLLGEVKKKELITKIDNREQLDAKERELKDVKSNISKKESQMRTQLCTIKLLKQELKQFRECVPSRLRLEDVLRLKFKEETENSSNYPVCLKSFLQSDILEKVDEVDGEIFLKFSSSRDLEKLLNSKCCKMVKNWSEISKLPQRADFVPRKLYKDFGLLVYLEETSLLVKTIKQVEDELKSGQAKVEYRNLGFAARFSTLLSFIQAVVNRGLYLHHRVVFMAENVSFMGGCGEVKFFNGKVCLTEEDFLGLWWKSEENRSLNPDGILLSFVEGLSCFLRGSKIETVCLDWNNEIVLTFACQQDLESLLQDHCTVKTSSLSKLSNLPAHFSLTSTGSLYSVNCPPDVDVRDFFNIDDTCFMSEDPLQISSKSRIFPFLCLSDPGLRALYPGLSLQPSNFVEL